MNTELGMYQPNKTNVMLALRGEEGQVNTRTAVGIGAVVLLAGVVFVGNRILNGLPDGQAVPENSRARVKTLAIIPADYHCSAQAAFDVSGSTGRTKYTFDDPSGTPREFNGFGAIMEEGKVVQDACIDSNGVKVSEPAKFGARYVRFIDLYVSKMKFNTNFSEPDTKVVPQNPPSLQFAGGTVDVLTGAARGACDFLAGLSPDFKPKCDYINIIAKWKNGEQADLERSLRVAVLSEAINKKCAPNEWKRIVAAETETYRKQAVAQGGKEEDVIVRTIGEDGKPTSVAPDMTRSTRDALIAKGVISKNTPGSPKVIFESVTCTPLSK